MGLKHRGIFIPKCRNRKKYSELLRRDAEPHFDCHLLPDHLHRMIAFSPKCVVVEVAGYSKRESTGTWREYRDSANEASQDNISGPADTSCQPWVETKRCCARTLAVQKAKVNGWNHRSRAVTGAAPG